MAYNNLSGTVFLPDKLTTKLTLPNGSVISGNLDYSNGENIVNVPRLNNAVSNAIITNVGGNYNTLTSNSNLTFDGETLSITGDITASVGLSASFLYGDGRFLINLPGGGSGGGIFSQVSDTQAYTTSSVNIGSSATPAHTLSVVGASYLSGGFCHKRVIKNSNYTVTVSDFFVAADTNSATVQFTLPAANTSTDGQVWVFKDEGGNAANNNITIIATGADKIDGQNSIVLESPYASVQLYSNGNDKFHVF
jgi:hypothetical protein